MKIFFSTGVILAAATAVAGPPKQHSTKALTPLMTCQSVAGDEARALIPFLYSKDQINFNLAEAESVSLLISQNPDNLFRARLDVLNKDGKRMRAAKTLQRIAFVEGSSTQTVSITYSKFQSSDSEGAESFNISSDESGAARLRFLQQNTASSKVPREMVDLTCSRGGAKIRVAKNVDVDSLVDDQAKISALIALKTHRPSASIWDDKKLAEGPKGMLANVLDLAKENMNTKVINVDVVRKEERVGKSAKIEILNGGKCQAAKWDHLKPILDYTGQIVAYSGTAKCTNPVAKITQNGNSRNTTLSYGIFYVTPKSLLPTVKTQIELETLYNDDAADSETEENS